MEPVKRRPGRPAGEHRYDQTFHVYTDAEGKALVGRLRERLGLKSDAEVIRRALQELAERSLKEEG